MTNVATQPLMEWQSAAITAHVNQKLSSDLPITGTIKVQAKRYLNGWSAMKWQSSSTRQKTLWLSWGC